MADLPKYKKLPKVDLESKRVTNIETVLDMTLSDLQDIADRGVSWRTNMAGTYTEFQANASTLPVTLPVAFSPMYVLCLDYVDTAGTHVSGAKVTWTYGNSAVVVSAIDGLGGSTSTVKLFMGNE